MAQLSLKSLTSLQPRIYCNLPQQALMTHVKRACRIQIVSDIHLEFRSKANMPIIKRHAENLALLGDIGKPFCTSYASFIGEQAETFDHIFVVMGNHEYYNAKKTC